MPHRRRLSQAHNMIKEVDVRGAKALPQDHKSLALRHFKRLRKILEESDEDNVGCYTTKRAALEQMARMTLVFRDYAARYARGECDDEGFESMAADIVDASFFVGGRQGSFEQPAFANALLMGREHEIAALMQEIEAGNVDDVIELWNVQERRNSVVPDSSAAVDNIAEGIDWTIALCRSASEDNLLCKGAPWIVIPREDRPKWTRSLSHRRLSALKRAWPPTSLESDEMREKLRAQLGFTEWCEDVYD